MKSHHVALLLLGFFSLGTEPVLATLRKKLGKIEAQDEPPTFSMATFQDICLFPPEKGQCKANMPRFFFNSTSWKCEEFIYGGCGGNENNFETREECLQVCSHRELLQPGDCPRRMLPGLPRPTKAYCIEDGPCPGEEKCCRIGNIRKCVLPFGVNPGFCPGRDNATVFTKHCSWDLDCAMDEKCCPSEGRRRCTKALPANPGLCPKKSLSRVSSPCEGECIDDRSCPKGQKCCFVDCGLKCVPPESHHSGQRVELDRHPSLEAGHKDICLLPPKQGDCDAYMPRFFYNSTSRRCETFIFGGCGGNENKFKTREDCYHACFDRALSKPGICPRRTVPVPVLPRSSKAYCAYDVSCPGDRKCCHFGNIKKCVLPIGVHPGYCPRRGDVAVPSKRCSWDSDCAMDEKCCPSEEHKRCTKAIPANPGLCPKKSLPLEFFPCESHCRDDRSCSKGLKCCFVGCGLKCIPPERHHSVERVALDQDHALTLPVHRGSWPLNSTELESRPSPDFCHLPSASGSCDAPSVHRVFYNSQARRCEKFPYKGCGGNRNNFATQLECLRSCSNPGICQLPMDQGIGDALRPRYFYNSDSRTCEHFIYRGHRGNTNNFWEEEDCLQFCGSHGKEGFCPAKTPPGVVDLCFIGCSRDSDCLGMKKCCRIECGPACLDPLPVKDGVCPPKLGSWDPRKCRKECTRDKQCPGKKKCCQVGCGKECLEAMPEKYGVCRSGGPEAFLSPCFIRCSRDNECPGKKKCCRMGCGLACLEPTPRIQPFNSTNLAP